MRYVLKVLLLLTLATLPGCGMTIYAPDHVQDPVSVFIADHGVHSSILLPREDGSIAQFAYSQWHWAALDQDDWYRSPFALVIPNTGTLGWRDFKGPCDFDCVSDRIHTLGRHPPMDALFEVEVERAEAAKVLAALDQRWKSQSNGNVFNEKRGMWWVKDASTYSIAHTCNQEVAEWLRSMGCRVTGMAKTASIKVVGGLRTQKDFAEEEVLETAGSDPTDF